MKTLVVRYGDKIKKYDLNKVDFDVNKDFDNYVRLHVTDKETGEVLLSLSLIRSGHITIDIQ